MRRWVILSLGVGLSCAGPEQGSSPGVEGEPERWSEWYAFCHIPGLDGEQLQDFCGLVDHQPPEVCPAMRETCEQALFAPQGAGCGGGGGGRATDRLAPLAWEERPWSIPSGGCEGEVPTVVESLLRWGLALGAALALLLFGGLLLRGAGLLRAGQRPLSYARESDSEGGAVDLPSEGTPSAGARAWEAWERGDLQEALRWGRIAARAPVEARLPDASVRTDRELLRAATSSEREVIEPLLRLVEQAWWAREEVDRTSVGQALRRLVGGAIFLGLIMVGNTGEGSAQEVSRWGPWGDAALVELLQAGGAELDEAIVALTDLSPDHEVLWLDLGFVRPSPADAQAVLDWVFEGGVAVVAGDVARLDPFPGRWSPWMGDGESWSPTEWILDDDRRVGLPAAPRWSSGPGSVWCLGPDDAGSPLLVLAEGGGQEGCERPSAVVLWSFGEGVFVVVADSSLWANASLTVPVNRDVVAALPEIAASLGEVDLSDRPRTVLATASRASADAPPAPLADPRFLPLLIQLLVVWGLAWWWLGRPRASVREEAPDPERRDGMAHVDALADQLRATGDEAWAARRYAQWAWEAHGPEGLQRAAVGVGYEPSQARAFSARTREVAEGRAVADLELVEELCRVIRTRR